jgi:hypothetical protein
VTIYSIVQLLPLFGSDAVACSWSPGERRTNRAASSCDAPSLHSSNAVPAILRSLAVAATHTLCGYICIHSYGCLTTGRVITRTFRRWLPTVEDWGDFVPRQIHSYNSGSIVTTAIRNISLKVSVQGPAVTSTPFICVCMYVQ